MRYGELFAGAGGLSLGLDRAGLECAFHAEVAEFPRKILKARWPNVPLYGDVATLNGADLVRECGAIDVLSGGSPCQGLSIAGKGAGLDDIRSSLFYQQVRIWLETNARWCLWENVPGALSSNKGADFAVILSTFLGTSITCTTKSGRWPRAGIACSANGVAAWRIRDAQYFGVPQRRRRVFVIATRSPGADPTKILFELESLRGDPAQGGGAGEGITADAESGAGSGRIFDARGNGHGALTPTLAGDHQNHVTDYTAIVAAWDPAQVTNPHNRSTVKPGQPCQSLVESPPAIVSFKPSHFTRGKAVLQGLPRRLMPVECERLMSWPDNFTRPDDSTPCADTPRYRACGNGVVSNVVQWIGERLLAYQ